jgi:hypothetical protein
MKPGFRTWLECKYPSDAAATRRANCKRVERHYGDLDFLYDTDRMENLLSTLEYSTEDETRGRRNPSKISIDGDLRTGLATLKGAVRLYINFREAETIERFPLTGTPERTELPRGSPATRPKSAVLNGDDMLLNATAELGIDLPRLIAKCAVWVNPAVFNACRRQHVHAAWFPDSRRSRKGEPKRGKANGVRFDDNTLANLAIKVAVFGSRRRCRLMHVCHVWPETCYDERYHTSLANLVLLPAPLAGLSDHHKAVAACLQYRSYELFNWYPEGLSAPVKPVGYPSASDWASARPIPQNVRNKFGIHEDEVGDIHSVVLETGDNILSIILGYLKRLLLVLH